MSLRILLLADTHLGFDLPLTPRVSRRRRGHDFLANFHRALAPALEGRVDAVIHGGDVFNRARPHHTLVAQAFAPLKDVADRGIPVFVVPGNHERSRIPHPRFATHSHVHIFDEPRTFTFQAAGRRVAIFGFPYERDVVRRRLPELITASGWQADQADVSLLCIHHCVEGATVGPADFTFRRGPDVIRCRDLPEGVDAVVSGHIHRHQVLTTDLYGRPLPAPVIYPGSVERTAFAEMGEPKGTVLLEIDDDGAVRWSFDELPARPMVETEVPLEGVSPAVAKMRVHRAVEDAAPDAVLRLKVTGRIPDGVREVLAAAYLRKLAPRMNVEVVPVDMPRPTRRRARVRAG